MRKEIAALTLSGILAGCVGPLVQTAKLEEDTTRQLTDSMPTYPAETTPRGARVIGPVTATSCKNKLWDKDPSREDAVAQLRYFARQQGANAVGNLTCEGIMPTSLVKNCWASITCTGTALTLNPPANR